MHENASLNNQLNILLSERLRIDTSLFPNVFDFFSTEVELTVVNGPHVGLMSSENLRPAMISNPNVVGIWLQAIDSTLPKEVGRVMEHDHGSDGVTEVIITENESVYAGLPAPVTRIGSYSVYIVPAGVRHGSNEQPSFGRWVSIKVKTGQEVLPASN